MRDIISNNNDNNIFNGKGGNNDILRVRVDMKYSNNRKEE